MATKRHNYGAGSNAGILGACLAMTFWKWILLILFIVWVPAWVWIVLLVAVTVFGIFYAIYSEEKKHE